jgi:hypothetical protein
MSKQTQVQVVHGNSEIQHQIVTSLKKLLQHFKIEVEASEFMQVLTCGIKSLMLKIHVQFLVTILYGMPIMMELKVLMTSL